MKHPNDPMLNGGVVLSSTGGREYRIAVPKDFNEMLRFLAGAHRCTEGEMAQRILLRGTSQAFYQILSICAQRGLEAARDALYGGGVPDEA